MFAPRIDGYSRYSQTSGLQKEPAFYPRDSFVNSVGSARRDDQELAQQLEHRAFQYYGPTGTSPPNKVFGSDGRLPAGLTQFRSWSTKSTSISTFIQPCKRKRTLKPLFTMDVYKREKRAFQCS
jgi:hypothetical protein